MGHKRFLFIESKHFSKSIKATYNFLLDENCFCTEASKVNIWSIVKYPFLNPACHSGGYERERERMGEGRRGGGMRERKRERGLLCVWGEGMWDNVGVGVGGGCNKNNATQ
jgi:hypothetical protein